MQRADSAGGLVSADPADEQDFVLPVGWRGPAVFGLRSICRRRPVNGLVEFGVTGAALLLHVRTEVRLHKYFGESGGVYGAGSGRYRAHRGGSLRGFDDHRAGHGCWFVGVAITGDLKFLMKFWRGTWKKRMLCALASCRARALSHLS